MHDCDCGPDCRALPADDPSVRVWEAFSRLPAGFKLTRPWPSKIGMLSTPQGRQGVEWAVWAARVAARLADKVLWLVDQEWAANDHERARVHAATAALYAQFVAACCDYVAAQTGADSEGKRS
jgi:hypothetical protein